MRDDISLISGTVYQSDNLAILKEIPDDSIDLIYIDPPFNTGKKQQLNQISTVRDDKGDRKGFGGHLYRSTRVSSFSFDDIFDDYLGFLEPRLIEAQRILSKRGSLYFHIDYREVHYCKILLDGIFGRDCFLNEIIWAYDFGGRPKTRWPAKHDNILLYVKEPGNHIFNYEEIDRIPYMAPGLVGPEKAAKGKLPTDTWWGTIVPTMGTERTGYPTQKPLHILRRIVQASSLSDSLVLDFFAGSGTTGIAAHEIGREFILVDSNPEAIDVMRKRFSDIEGIRWVV